MKNVLRYVGLAGAEIESPWSPLNDNLNPAVQPHHYVVNALEDAVPPHRFRTIQAAIDQAMFDADSNGNGNGNGNQPYVIHIRKGHYTGPVYIPRSAPKLHLIGECKTTVVLAARIDAQMPGLEFRDRFAKQFSHSHPSTRAVFERIAAREKLTTGNTSVLRIERDDAVISNLSIMNLYACDRQTAAPDGEQADSEGRYANGQHQAVALHVAGADKVHLDRLYLSSFQDTLYLQSPQPFSTGRTYVSNCHIEGDVDFIFGQAAGYFHHCEIRSRGLRGAISWATAPSTNIRSRYGFVFSQCQFSHDGAETGKTSGCYLGRQWFEGVRASPYGKATDSDYQCLPGTTSRLDNSTGWISQQTLESVGKCIIIDSEIGSHINHCAPWCDWNGASPLPDGTTPPFLWNPRYRPAQASTQSFLDNLGEWLIMHQLDYADLDTNEIWLGESHNAPLNQN